MKGRMSVFSMFTTAGLMQWSAYPQILFTPAMLARLACEMVRTPRPWPWIPFKAAPSSTARCSFIRWRGTLVLPHVPVIVFVSHYHLATHGLWTSRAWSDRTLLPLVSYRKQLCKLLSTPGMISLTLLNWAAVNTAPNMQSNSPASSQSGNARAPFDSSHRKCDATCVVRWVKRLK
jgi:hypothetical protein